MKDREPILYTPVRYYEDGEAFNTGEPGFQVLVTGFSYQERGRGDRRLLLRPEPHRVPGLFPADGGGASQFRRATATAKRAYQAGGPTVRGRHSRTNGRYYYSSYGDEPYGSRNGRRCKVSRIIANDSSRAYPVHITTEAAVGWAGPKQAAWRWWADGAGTFGGQFIREVWDLASCSPGGMENQPTGSPEQLNAR